MTFNRAPSPRPPDQPAPAVASGRPAAQSIAGARPIRAGRPDAPARVTARVTARVSARVTARVAGRIGGRIGGRGCRPRGRLTMLMITIQNESEMERLVVCFDITDAIVLLFIGCSLTPMATPMATRGPLQPSPLYSFVPYPSIYLLLNPPFPFPLLLLTPPTDRVEGGGGGREGG